MEGTKMVNSNLAPSFSNPLAFNPLVQNEMGNGRRNGSYWSPWCPWISWNGNLPDATVGSRDFLWWNRDVKGYGIDLDGNGQYDKGTDGVLVFDYNKDGKLSDKEIKKSREMLKSMDGDYDFDGDGKVSFSEKMRGRNLQKLSKKYDKNGDGRLDGDELQQGNAKVWIDRNKDGRADGNEAYDPKNIPTPWGRGSIDYVDPRFNQTQVRYPWMPWGEPGPVPQPYPPFPGPSPFPGPGPIPGMMPGGMDPYMMQMMMIMMMGGGMNGGSMYFYFFMMMGGGMTF